MNPLLYVHGGSGNHGCEAILRTFLQVLKTCGITKVLTLSANIKEDERNGLTEYTNIQQLLTKIDSRNLFFLYAYLRYRLSRKSIYLDILPRREQIKKIKGFDVAFAIGGDTYSYKYDEHNTFTHDLFRKKGMKTVLWSCSINPELLEDKRVLKDIRDFDMVTARESITYQALKKQGIKDVRLFPDLAFALQRKECSESHLIIKGRTIGLNISPMVQSYQNGDNSVIANCRKLIEFILRETDNYVAMIPHVVWPQNDDHKAMSCLYDEYKSSGRIIWISDHNCMELKDIIARCRLFVCARTHASIAAYSSCVPTLVLGYSVKARGIAKDIFGTEENYVLPVQSLKEETDLTDAFKWLLNHEHQIRKHLEAFMPTYIAGTEKAKEAINSLL